jgi:O-antigen/teichoic acid export membrane protein
MKNRVKDFVSDGLVYFLLKLIVGVFYFLQIKIYTSLINPVDFGCFSLLFFLSNTIAISLSSPLSSATIRFYNEFKENKYLLYNSNLNKAITYASCFLLVLIVLCYSINQPVLDLIRGNILLFVPICLLQTVFLTLLSRFSAERNPYGLVRLNFARLIISLLVSVLLLKNSNYGYKVILLGEFIGYFITTLYLFFSQAYKNYQWVKLDNKYNLPILSYITPLFFLNFFVYALTSVDQVFIKSFQLNNDLGVYSANYGVIDRSMGLINGVFASAFAPILFQIGHEKGMKEAHIFFKKMFSWYILGCAVFAIVLLSSYPFIAKYFLDTKYNRFDIIPYLVFGVFFYSITHILSELFTLHQKTRLLCFCYLIPLIINIICNWYFIPIYGIFASSVITLVSYVLLLLIMSIFSFKFLYNNKQQEKVESAVGETTI